MIFLIYQKNLNNNEVGFELSNVNMLVLFCQKKSNMSIIFPETNQIPMNDEHLIQESKHQITEYVRTHFLVPETELSFVIGESFTTVKATYQIKPSDPESIHDLVLNGEKSVVLDNITCNGTYVPHFFKDKNDEHTLVVDKLVVKQMLGNNESFFLTVECKINPDKNTELSGLYRSNGTYCTQCESHGFRRIVYSFDRPDVLSRYTVNITTDPLVCPVVLSNGNMIRNQIVGQTQVTVWVDPHPKPSYLFALVAGDLGHIESSYQIRGNPDPSARVILRIYAPHNKMDQLDLAMRSIKQAMMWDEEKFGLCYDLDLFNIVCLDDFNAGAMENKGLNIFNSKYVLATPKTATDTECELITGVIGHEYFHNWTGDRVTLEKWFDLTLKEGLTVFRDQSFSCDIGTSRVRYIIDRAIDLRNGQFMEDAGANAHPIRPRSYKVMDNFYTSTVYDKGAEVVRIYETLLGVQGFRRGMELYFKRHDGQAVACEDFWRAMFDANTVTPDARENFTVPMQRLFNWYHQAGTPSVSINYRYDTVSNKMVLRCTQTNSKCREINGTYEPVLLPIKMGLVHRTLKTGVVPLNITQYNEKDLSFILNFYELEQEFVLEGVTQDCVPSFMRDFSAPCITTYDMSMNDRLFLMMNDLNQFNRWEQSQIIHKYYMCELYKGCDNNIQLYVNLMSNILQDDTMDAYLKAYLLNLPLQDDMYSVIPECDPVKLYETCTRSIYGAVASSSRIYLEKKTFELMRELMNQPYDMSHHQVSSRELMRTVMKIRLSIRDEFTSPYINTVLQYFDQATNFTDVSNCISALSTAHDPNHEIYQILQSLLENLAKRFEGDSLMTSKWLRFMTKIASPQTVEDLTRLYKGSHSRSDMINKTTPNHLYALVKAYTLNPYVHQLISMFGQDIAPGYKYITDCVLDIDKYNSNVAASIASFFDVISSLSPRHQVCMKVCIQHILATPGLSENVKELLSQIK